MGFVESASMGGVGLEVANAIRTYLDKANGDARLALALSVADRIAMSASRTIPRHYLAQGPRERSGSTAHGAVVRG